MINERVLLIAAQEEAGTVQATKNCRTQLHATRLS